METGAFALSRMEGFGGCLAVTLHLKDTSGNSVKKRLWGQRQGSIAIIIPVISASDKVVHFTVLAVAWGEVIGL